jgi:hypothetical protein
MAGDPPIHVYPDPDGNPDSEIPSSEPLAQGAIATGAGAVGAAGAGVLLGFILPPGVAGSASFSAALVFARAVNDNWIYASIALGGLSLILQVVNYVRGKKIKERNLTASREVCKLDKVKEELKKFGFDLT